MADLLTHVLVPYVLLTVASWRVGWITDRWIAVGMGGAAIPDLVKIHVLIDDSTVASALGVPFSFDPISSIAGLVLLGGAIALLFGEYRRRAFAFLAFGGATALALDGLRVFADGRSDFWLYPLWWRPPTPSLYVTSNPLVLAVALVVAGGVFTVDRYRRCEAAA
ncbi:MAG: hypothetical protein ABEJ89_00470 [Haloarculaceae archaeon]